jgi:hypothetical protein
MSSFRRRCPSSRSALAGLIAVSLLAHAASAMPPAGADGATPMSALVQQGSVLTLDAAFAARMRAAGPTVTLPGVTLADGTVVTLELERFQVVAHDIETRIGRRTAPGVAEAMRAVQHFRGEVVGAKRSSVYLAVSDRGAAATIDLGPGRERYTLRPVGGTGAGLVRGAGRFDRTTGTSAPDVPMCGGVRGDRGGRQGGVAGSATIPAGAVPTIEIAIDTDFEYFTIFGNVIDAAEYISSVYGAVSAIYQRDVGARVEIVFTRFFDVPEDLYNDPDPLYPFRDDWNATMTMVERDLAHFVSGRRNLPYGGVAWLDASCTDFGYCVNGYIIGSFADPVATNPGNWDINVIAHELGHNVASLHTHSYGLDACNAGAVQRGSIMSYCHINSGASANIDLEFHRVCVEEMESFIAGAPQCMESDCDGDGVSDAQAVEAGAADADGDGIPDACQDCDGDGVLDSQAIAQGLVKDSDGDGTPDGCQPDCNGNGIPDGLDISLGTSVDAYGNGVPDECEPDCNGDGVSDLTEIQLDMQLDRNRDGILDACEDCDGDGVLDLVELAGGLSIWTGGQDGFVRELHPRSGVLLRAVDLGADIFDLAIGPNGLLYASSGRFVRPIDRATASALPAIVDVGSGSANGLAFANDGSLLVAHSLGGVGRYTTDGTFLGWIGGGKQAAPTPRDVAVRADGRILVTSTDGRIRQFLANGTPTTGFDGSGQGHDYFGVIESPDAAFIIVASRAQGALVRFDAATRAYLGRFDVQSNGLLSRASGVAVSGNGKAYLATSSASSSTLNGYNIKSGYLERTYRSYGVDAGPANAVIVAPKSSADQNGDFVPDDCQTALPDLDGNGVVNAADLAILLGAWNTAGADLNGDGTTDALDLAVLLGAWTA